MHAHNTDECVYVCDSLVHRRVLECMGLVVGKFASKHLFHACVHPFLLQSVGLNFRSGSAPSVSRHPSIPGVCYSSWWQCRAAVQKSLR